MSYTIESIAEYIGARRVGEHEATIDWLLTDSRSLSFPEETLFFALPTKRNNGARYISELYDRGVRNFVVTEEDFKRMENGEWKMENAMQQDGAQPTPNSRLSILDFSNFLIVANPLKALQKLAEAHRENFKIPVIGITGSNGKTIVKEWLHQLLSPDRCIVRSPRSYNSQIGVPLSVWQLNEEAELGIFEAGISEMGEMGALKRMIKPTIGILTNIGGAHQENFFSLQEKCMEKLTLFKDCDVVIYNGDNELISNCVAKSMLTAREIAWSCKDIERPLYISKVTKKEDHTVIAYRYLDMDNIFCIPFIDDASIENALNCLAACLYLGLGFSGYSTGFPGTPFGKERTETDTYLIGYFGDRAEYGYALPSGSTTDKEPGHQQADRCRSGDFFVCRSLRRYAGTILLPRYRRLAKIGHF